MQPNVYSSFIMTLRQEFLGPVRILTVVLDSSHTASISHVANISATNVPSIIPIDGTFLLMYIKVDSSSSTLTYFTLIHHEFLINLINQF